MSHTAFLAAVCLDLFKILIDDVMKFLNISFSPLGLDQLFKHSHISF